MFNLRRFSLGAVGAALFVGGALTFATSPAEAAVFTYKLHSHPKARAASAFYGLRLDGLLSGDERDTYAFDFDAEGASVFLDYDDIADTLHIYGTAYGGKDIRRSYEDPTFWEIDFTYTDVTTVAKNLVSNQGTGTIRNSANTFDLEAYQGKHRYAFYFGPNGHRLRGDNSTYTGRGWLKHNGPDGGDAPINSAYLKSADWLFTAEKVPEPTAILGLLLFGALGGRAIVKREETTP